MKACIVIPIYNEIKAIGDVVRRVVAEGMPVIVVDDGSTDGSGDAAAAAGATVFRNTERHGKGFSLQHGFAEALAAGYNGVIAMDGDGQHDPADLAIFRREMESDPRRVINGNRMATVGDMPWLRRTTNRFMSWLISRICRQKIPDTQCGFRYIPAELLQKITISAKAYEIETELLIKASRQGYPITSVAIRTIYEGEESKVNPVRDTWRFIVYILKEIFRTPSRGG